MLTIQNPKTKIAIACRDLKSERRLFMTGTPIVNTSKDVGAMLSFLTTCAPLNDPKEWSKLVERKMRKGNGSQVLKAVVRSTTLRRTKEMKDSAGNPLVKLPGVKYYTIGARRG